LIGVRHAFHGLGIAQRDGAVHARGDLPREALRLSH
jgi:hypothetical protein